MSRRRSQEGFVGGMVPRIGLIRRARRHGPVLVLDAGNALGPSPLSAWDQGTTMIDLMRLAGYTALLPANHEFDFGAETLKRRQTRGAFPFLGTNLSVDDDKTAVFSKHPLIETAGPRIGVLGLLSQEVAILTNPEHFNGIQISDPLDAATLIARTEDRYAKTAGDTIGLISGDTHQNPARMISRLMRRHTDAEIGILNLCLIQQIPTDQPLIRRHISRFMRFPNSLQTIELTGAQLRSAISQSNRVNRTNARLIFAGLDPNTLRVEGRPLKETEQYRVAITDFLAKGGDGYAVFTQSPLRIDTGMGLRILLQKTLRNRGRLTSASFRQGNRRGIWHSGLQVEGAFERNYVDRTTEVYRAQNERVPFLSGATTVAWNGALRYYLEREDGPHVTRYENRMDFSQIGKSFGELTPSTGQVETEIRYRYRTLESRGDPFISVGFNTAFTSLGGQRPMQGLSTVGFEYQPFQSLIVRVAGRSQRDFVADKTDLGGELTFEWTRPLQSGALLNSRVRRFFGVTNRRVVSIENYSTISFPLLGDVRLNIRQNNFLYRVNRIGGVATEGIALRTIVTVGFACGLNWKWL